MAASMADDNQTTATDDEASESRPAPARSRRRTGTAAHGPLKQRVLQIYNAVNQQMWQVGVRQQRIDFLGDRILIVAEHQRVPALATLDAENRALTRIVDCALIDENRRRLREELESTLDLKIRAILKDYDPRTQLAATLIVLEEAL